MPECLKDLQRFLRHDEASTRDAFFVLGKAQTTRTHLIPLITKYAGDVDTVYNACKAFLSHQHLWPRASHRETASVRGVCCMQ